MLGLDHLDRRLRAHGLCLVEPEGQDGRLCQYLAILDQLKLIAPEAQLPSSGYDLESELLAWLNAHGLDVTGVHGAHGDAAEVSLLHESWAEPDLKALRARTAWGDHNSLCAMLSMLGQRGIRAQAQVFDSRGEEYDAVVLAHDVYEINPERTLRLAFAGSLVACAVPGSPFVILGLNALVLGRASAACRLGIVCSLRRDPAGMTVTCSPMTFSPCHGTGPQPLLERARSLLAGAPAADPVPRAQALRFLEDRT